VPQGALQAINKKKRLPSRPPAAMEQMLRNTIAEQERELARRRGAREGDRDRMADRSTAASEQLSQLSIFYALVQTVGSICRLLGILWWLQAMHAGDGVHSSRLAPAAALWMAKVAWGLVDSAIRGQRAALKADVGAHLPPAAAILEQCLPVACAAVAVFVAWVLHPIPQELGYARLAAVLTDDQQLHESAAAAAGELAASFAGGVALALFAIGAPVLLQKVGVLRSSWPADPVKGLERQHLASLAEKARQRELQLTLSRNSSLFSGSALVYGVSRAARLSCLALSEELLYRSVLYAYLGWLLDVFVTSDPASSLAPGRGFELLPALLSSLCFGGTFMSYHGEWAVGTAIGLLLQAMAVSTSSLLPAVLAHVTMELLLDGYRSRRPVPKPQLEEAEAAAAANQAGKAGKAKQ
jgi:membrane protease YdiL (CAAX protease family)